MKWFGFHIRICDKEEGDFLKKLLKEYLIPLDVNLLVIEVNTCFRFEKHPEVSEGTFDKTSAREISSLCKENDVEIVPLFNCLGHQGWKGKPNGLLRAYPEFDETPEIPYDSEDIYCRSWCPSHPRIYDVVFSLIDEIQEAFESRYFHVGMDEVFIIARCPRCRGKDPAHLFSDTAKKLHDHLLEKGVKMMMWGDRLIKRERTPYSEWEADDIGIYPAVDMIPKDVVVVDWHYEPMDRYPSIPYFLEKGFKVLPACWKNLEAAKRFFEYSKKQAKKLDREENVLGILVTDWHLPAKKLYEAFKEKRKEDLMEVLEYISKSWKGS